MEYPTTSKRFALAFTAALLASGAAVASAEQGPRFVSLTLENDIFAGSDRHYTNGFQAAFVVGLDDVPEGLRGLPPFAWSADRAFVLAIGQRIFTPEDVARQRPDPGDRPYAGWLYVMADWRVRSGAVVDHLTANIGVAGPNAHARQTQNSVHRMFRRDEVRGWDAQIDNRVTVMLGYERAWKALLQGRSGSMHFDFTPRVSGSVGNVLTHAGAGAVLRYGSDLPSDLPATHISLGPPRDGYRGAAASGWYVWAGIDARVVARNIFIDGNDGPGVHLKRTGYDVQLGATLVWPLARLGLALVQRSREFEGQRQADRFGQVTVSFPY
jgi:lipid A 3-O-deacylase